MKYAAIAIATPLLAGQVAAYGNAIIKNLCAETVYYWEDNGDPNHVRQSITKGGQYLKEMYQTGKGNGAGPSIKLARPRDDGSEPVYGVDPITQLEYTCNAPTSPGTCFWDTSNVNGNAGDVANAKRDTIPSLPPFVPGGMTLIGGSVTKTCPAGQNPCTSGYTGTQDNWAVGSSPMNLDLTLEICGPKQGASLTGGNSGSSGSSGSQQQSQQQSSPPSSSSSSSPPVASPSQPPSGVEEKLAKQPNVVVTVTATAPAAMVTVHVNAKREEEEKRSEHIHNHAHAHNKFNKRRHGA